MSCSIHAYGRREPDVGFRRYLPVFKTANQARSWFMAFISNQPHYFEDDKTILLTTDFEIRLRSREWPEIMAAPVANEPLPDDVLRMIARFKHGSWEERHDATERCDATTGEKPAKPERAPKAQRPPGYVTITELCAASGTPAMLARAALRASGRVKPDYGWAFSPQELPAIKQLCGIK